jgi:protein-S-isoprenylcysteine O-methyltransferase Ste14
LKKWLWGVVGHPNYAGYLMWRIALAMAVGGWAFGGLLAWVRTKAAADASIPSIEMQMEKMYGKHWDKVKGRVRWKLVPYVY